MIDWNPLITKCHAAAVANGWWEQPRPIEETLMLVVTEVAEAVEWYRDFRDDASVFKPHWEVPSSGVAVNKEDVGTDKDAPPDWKPVGIPSELADVAIRVCDLMGYEGFTCPPPDVLAKIEDAPQTGSFIGDCNTIAFCVSGAEDSAHLSIALATVERIATRYGIDLAAAIETKLAYNATRGHRHGGKRA